MNTLTSKSEIKKEHILITRIFDAPIELVYQAWTDPKLLLRWYAPNGCSIGFKQIEVKEGGEFHSCIRTPDNHDCWCKGKYLELIEPTKIVFSMGVSDEDGNFVEPVSVGMDAAWPSETLVTVILKELGDKTKLTLHQTVNQSLAKRTGAYPSWLQMFDRLAHILSINHEAQLIPNS